MTWPRRTKRWRGAQAKLDELLDGRAGPAAHGRPMELSAQRDRRSQLAAGEDEALETEKRVLANAEKLYAAAMSAFEQLYEGGASAEAALRAAMRNVEELARYDAQVQ